MKENNLQGIFHDKDFSFSKGFSNRLMERLEKELIQETYSNTFRQMSWMSAAAMILLFLGAYFMGDSYTAELSYTNWDEYLLYND